MTKVVVAEIAHTCEKLIGTFLDDSHYDTLVEEDMDFYAPISEIGRTEPSEEECIFKFRKGVFSPEEQLGAYDGLVGAAQPTQNRGMAAGPKSGKLGGRDWVTDFQFNILDSLSKNKNNLFGDNPIAEIERKYKNAPSGSSRGMVWLRNKIADEGYTYEQFFNHKLEEWKKMDSFSAAEDAKKVRKSYISDTTYANAVNSGIAGFFDRYPRIPYGRATSYTAKNYDLYEKCFPFMITLAEKFSSLLPSRFAAQNKEASKLDPRFRVAGENTPFTTITVNKNFRTAAHRDAGDLSAGFSNLTVVSKDREWEGGYLVLPQYRIAINVRPGDLLLINNHEGIHGNTEIVPPAGKKIEDMERISLVCYFREKMTELKSWEYEQHRYDFVESRRLAAKDPKFNGVTAGMWDNQEWYDYLKTHGGEKMLEKYHPQSQTSTLEAFF